jgi:4-hydroxy-2-oxoheptanedioate aldolase
MSVKMRKIILRKNRPVLLFGLCLGSERVAEMISNTSVDIGMVDLQHSHLDKVTATNCIRTLAENDGPVPLARVSDNISGMVNTLLDAGAMGILFPMIQNKEEALKAVGNCYYPPMGHRSKSGIAATFYGPDYFEQINKDVAVVLMIETPEAAAKADEILSVKGIGGCLIGASDLTFNLKQNNKIDQMSPIVESIVKSGKKYNVPIGISVGSPDDLEKWWNKGVDFFLVSHDMGVLAKAIPAHIQQYTNLELKSH